MDVGGMAFIGGGAVLIPGTAVEFASVDLTGADVDIGVDVALVGVDVMMAAGLQPASRNIEINNREINNRTISFIDYSSCAEGVELRVYHPTDRLLVATGI